MSNRPSVINEGGTTRNKGYDYTSLEKFLAEEMKGETEITEKVKKMQKKASEELIKARKAANKKAIEELATLEKTLAFKNLKMTNEQKKRYLLEFEKEQRNQETKALLDYWKTYGIHARNEEKREQKRLDDQARAYEKASILRASADEKREKANKKEQEIAELRLSLAEAQANGDKDEAKRIKEQLSQANKDLKEAKKEAKKAGANKDDRKANRAEKQELSKEDFEDVFHDAFADFRNEKERGSGEVLGEDLLNTMKGVGKAIEEGLNQINDAISDYASYQTEINARMQGARGETVEIFGQLEDKLSSVSYSPLIKTETLYENLSDLVAEGIAANVEQRAFLQTVKDGIATTFDANDSSLRRIIRLQQYDSTAARLGMEAYLTSYLNELTQNTEYLQSTFDSVAESLLEASSLMTAQSSTEFEYVIQKWLGTLEGLGLSEDTATNIATAMGYLGSGNISELASSDMQNLLVMATVKSGLSYSDLLTNGLNADTANQIMYNVVNYMAELGSNSSNVVKSQLASTFGVKVSDLVAASNIFKDDSQSSTITNLYNNLLTYNDMYNELSSQMGLLKEREGISNILENLFSNFTYSTGMDIASKPALYATWKITDMIQGVTGGINIPYISAFGSGLDLNTTVENLMKLAIVGVSTIGGIGDIISGVSSIGNGSSLLTSLGIGSNAGTNTLVRGSGLNSRATGTGTSISTMIGNANGQDYYNSALTSAEDSAQEDIDAASSEEQSIDKLLSYTQGEGKEISESTRDAIVSLNTKIDNGITVHLADDVIVRLTD